MLCNHTYTRGVKSGAVCGKIVRNPANAGKCYAHSKRKTDIKVHDELEKMVSKAKEEHPDKKIKFVIGDNILKL
jgi:hypothetical protein